MADPSVALALCISPSFAALSKAIHSLSLRLGSLSDIHLATRLVGAYCKCGQLSDACNLFDEMFLQLYPADTVAWNSIISGCIHGGKDPEAFHYFKRMQYCSSEYETLRPDSYTLSSLLSSSYCLWKSPRTGNQLHAYAIKSGAVSGASVGNALITLYASWGHLSESKAVFLSLSRPNVVSWTALISGYAKNCTGEEEAIRLFVQMMREARPNQFTWASLFSLCANIAWFAQGICFLPLAQKMGFLSYIHVQNSLVDFYAECGCLEEAQAVFDGIVEPDIVSWNSLLKGYSQQGRGDEALVVFEGMCRTGPMPDSVTFLLVLSACSHSGKTSLGLALYRKMEEEFKIEPRTEHVSSIVNMLGRAGQLQEAEEFIRNAECQLGSPVWRTLLGACRAHGNSSKELAELAAKELLLMEPYDAEAFLALSHIYAANGKWDQVGNLRREMKEKGIEKEPGFSSIEVKNKIHTFVAADWAHSQIYEIVTTVTGLTDITKDEEEFD